MIRFTGILLVLLMVWQSGICAPKPLRVGIAPDFEPVIFERDGIVRGIEVDFARLVAKRLGREIRFVKLSRFDLIPQLKDKKIDIIMSGLSVTKDRALHVAFTEPYMKAGQMALTRIDEAGRYQRRLDLLTTSGRVGYQSGTTGAVFAETRMPNAELYPFDETSIGLQALRTGMIDLYIHDAPTVWRVASDINEQDLIGIFWPLTTESLAWAVHRDDETMLAVLNAALEEWRASGLVRSVVNRWITIQVEVE